MSIVRRLQSAINRVLEPADLRVIRHTAIGNDLRSNVARILKRSPKLVFDVGANVGQTATTFRGHWPDSEIVCFEPSSGAYVDLVRSVGLDRRTKCYQLALGDFTGEASFNEFPESTANSFLDPVVDEASPQWLNERRVTRVKTQTLDAWCSEHDVAHVDLLKIDTQGADDRVLRGSLEMLSTHRVSMVYFEVTFARYYETQGSFSTCHALLTERGYRFVDFYDRVRDETGISMAYCNALYASERVIGEPPPPSVARA